MRRINRCCITTIIMGGCGVLVDPFESWSRIIRKSAELGWQVRNRSCITWSIPPRKIKVAHRFPNIWRLGCFLKEIQTIYQELFQTNLHYREKNPQSHFRKLRSHLDPIAQSQKNILKNPWFEVEILPSMFLPFNPSSKSQFGLKIGQPQSNPVVLWCSDRLIVFFHIQMAVFRPSFWRPLALRWDRATALKDTTSVPEGMSRRWSNSTAARCHSWHLQVATIGFTQISGTG